MAQVTGTGFYPTNAQYAANYINWIKRNFTDKLVLQNLWKSTPFLRYVLQKRAQAQAGGFNPITQPIQLATFGNQVQYTGFNGNVTPNTLTNPAQVAQWNQSLATCTLDYMIPELALMAGSGAEQYVVIDTVKARMYDAYEATLAFMSSAFLGSAGSNTLAFNGILDAVDNGTNAPNYGGIPRATYANWNSHVYVNNQGANPAYQQLYYYLSSFKADGNNPTPTLGLTSPEVFQAVLTSFTSIERMIVAQPKNIMEDRSYSVEAIDVGGVPLVVDPNLTSNDIYYLNMEHMFYKYCPTLNFKMTEPSPLESVGLLGYRQTLMVCGQFITDLPSAHFHLSSAPSTTLA